jgi:hypothetical protein
VSSDLVIYDNDGRRRGQMLNLENFLHPDVAIAADVRSLEKQIKWQSGLTPWDIGNASLKRWCRQQLGLDTYLAPDRYWNSESLKEFKQTALKFRLQIKAALNFTVTDEMASVQILNQLLEQMGVDCTAQQTRKAGERIRTYSLDLNCWQQNSEILERRKVRRNQLKDVTPPLFSNQTKGGCDTDTSEPEKLEQWRWGTSLSPWVIERIEGEQALIRGVSNVPFRVAVAELSHWEDSA